MWQDIVKPLPSQKGKQLDTVAILPAIGAGMEFGMPIPQAGADHKWLHEHQGEIAARANQGDVRFKNLVTEMLGK